MIIDIEGMHGFVVSSPSRKSAYYSVCLPHESDPEITCTMDKEVAIREMQAFVSEAKRALETLYGLPGGGGTPALVAVV